MLLSAAALFVLTAPQVPTGIRYKRAPEAVNSAAKAKLEKLFRSSPKQAEFGPVFDEATIVGPGLFSAFGKKKPVDISKAKPVTFFVPTGKGMQRLKGCLVQTTAQKEDLGIALLLLAKSPVKSPKIRKANPDELRYYWAMISFDIEEPLYIVEQGKQRMLFDLTNEKDPKVSWVDLLGSAQ